MRILYIKFGSLALRESNKLENSIHFQWHTFHILQIAHLRGFNKNRFEKSAICHVAIQNYIRPSNRVSSEPVVMSTQDMKTPLGFVYDPSLPMSLDYQLIAFERQKAAEEKQKDDRKYPKSKRILSGEPDMMRYKTTPSPPNPFKRIFPPGIM